MPSAHSAISPLTQRKSTDTILYVANKRPIQIWWGSPVCAGVQKHRITEQSFSWRGDSKRPGDVRVDRQCQEERAVERVPERSGLEKAGMLTNTGFVFHECSTYSGIHPCGAVTGQASLLCTVDYPPKDALNTYWFFIPECHRSHTCPDYDLLQERITLLFPELPSSQSSPVHFNGVKFEDVVEYAARVVAV